MTTRNLGKLAEDFVVKYLVKRGLKIIARNVSYVFGEIDIVAIDRDVLVFVEVKYRKNDSFGEPFLAVTTAKQKKIIRAAEAFLQRYKSEPNCRFDVIALTGEINAPKIEHISDAFGLLDEAY